MTCPSWPLDEEAIRNVHRLYIIGCGSAYHVGMAARYVFESLARIPVEVDVASEFRYRNPVTRKGRTRYGHQPER